MVTAINDDMFAGEAIADPYTYYGRLRVEDPAHWNEKYELWVVTRYDDVVWLARHPEYFSSATFKDDPRPAYPEIEESDLGLYEDVRNFFSRWFIQHDRPVHLDMRQVLHGYFTPKSMEEWRPMVTSVIKDLLDEADENGEMDVMRDFATPLPLFVIAQMMGMPYEDRGFIRSLAEKLLFLGRGDIGRMQPLHDGIFELIDYLSPVVEERILKPENDFISVLADGERRGIFTREQVVANSILLLLAGHETTINLICNGTLAFMQHPDQWRALKNDSSEALPPLINRATEECLRYDAPVKSLQRIVAEDVELAGKVMRKGERIRWFISGANRDPEKFEDADTFNIARWPNPHVGFGSGIHHCLGAALARLEGQEAFKALLGRYDNLSLQTSEFEYQPSITFRSLKALPVSMN
jgi:cytochrome P450